MTVVVPRARAAQNSNANCALFVAAQDRTIVPRVADQHDDDEKHVHDVVEGTQRLSFRAAVRIVRPAAANHFVVHCALNAGRCAATRPAFLTARNAHPYGHTGRKSPATHGLGTSVRARFAQCSSIPVRGKRSRARKPRRSTRRRSHGPRRRRPTNRDKMISTGRAARAPGQPTNSGESTIII